MSENAWYEIENVGGVDSPALLVYPDRVEENLRRMIALTGGVSRLRPHMKTHKLPEIIRLHLAHGLTRFKCATIAEAEMTAACGATDMLFAYQPVGPKIERFIRLVRHFPRTTFSTIADNERSIRALSAAFGAAEITVDVLLDIDCGMHRSGIEPGPAAVTLYRLLAELPGLQPGGLHVYDGHIRESDPAQRAALCAAGFAPARALRDELTAGGLPVPRLVAGGTPTFPIQARSPDVECSPGTCVFWDAGYSTRFPDMDFLHAALVLTRVVSKPGGNRVCVDLGHKAIASENPHPRVQFLNLPDAHAVSHSEEHLVVETPAAAGLEIGACLYGVPWHVCPTVALYSEAMVVRDGQTRECWEVTARRRRLTC